MVTMPRQNEVYCPDDSGKEGNTSICSFFLLLFFTFSEVIDGHVWPHYTMRSWPGRPAASVRGRCKCKWCSNWNRWSLRSMVGRWLGGINSLRSGGENDGSANSPPAFSHINSSRKVSPTTTNSPFERTSPLLWPKQCNYSTLPNALNMSHIMTLSQVEFISSL